MKPKVVLLVSGKRKCGKDYLSAQLLSRIGTDKCEIIRISEPIKSHFAEKQQLDLNQLLGDGPYKEIYRKQMIQWSDEVRKETPGYFCNISMEKVTRPVVIISDIRRKTDIKYFQENGYNIKAIRVNASEEVRRQRGWIFESGVDDVQSECDLDDYKHWDLLIENDGVISADIHLKQILMLINVE